jgi:2-oxoglutarate ferredoxin oxidoreductase subunit alpha
VVEQNRDAQMRTLLVNELSRSGALIPVLHYDGTPITARFITQAIAEACFTPERAHRSAKDKVA